MARIGRSGSCYKSKDILESICIGGDLTAIQEGSSAWNSGSEVWSEQKMCQWREPYRSQEQGGCDEDNECGSKHARERRGLMREGEMIINKKPSCRRDTARCCNFVSLGLSVLVVLYLLLFIFCAGV